MSIPEITWNIGTPGSVPVPERPFRPRSRRSGEPCLQSSHNCHYSTISACSLMKPPRGNRKVRSNVNLCNDIREFLSSVGLPENHVPSTKELSQHGRQDLANIVRRRGYKFIRKLLETSSTQNFIGSNKDAEDITFEIRDGKRDDVAGRNIESQTSMRYGNEGDLEKVENEDEVKRLKFLLHQKEFKLTRLKQQIEKEKLALSMLHIKAETEISKAHKIISEIETELYVAKETLSGLKEIPEEAFSD